MYIIDVARGETWGFPLELKYDNGVAVDLTDSTVWFTMKKNINDLDDEAILSKEFTISTPTSGECIVEFEPSETIDIIPKRYIADIEILFAGGQASNVWFDGEPTFTIKVLADVRRGTA